MELTSIPDEEWAQVEAAAFKFWDEIAAESRPSPSAVRDQVFVCAHDDLSIRTKYDLTSTIL